MNGNSLRSGRSIGEGGLDLRPSGDGPRIVMAEELGRGQGRLLFADDSGAMREISSVGYDPSLEGIGSDWLGGRGSTLIRVPAEPTTAPNRRILIHACCAIVRPNEKAAIKTLRQAYEIGVYARGVDLQDPLLDGEMIEAAIDQTSPFWRFPDGNIVAVVTWSPGSPKTIFGNDPQPPAPIGWTTNLYTKDSAVLYQQVAPYIPPNGGKPPGELVDSLFLRDLRYPWQNTLGGGQLSYWRMGPGRFDLWFSIRQTNPLRERGLQPQTSPTFFRTEDLFVDANPLARYTGVAGAMIVQYQPSRASCKP